MHSSYPLHSYGYMQPTGPVDKLTQLQGLDNMSQQADSGRTNDMLHMLSTLYGIQHESAMQPEQIRALQASNTAKEFENTNAPAASAADVGLKQAQAANFQANADATKKYDVPDLHSLMLMHQMGGLPDSDFYTALGKVPGMQDVSSAGIKRISDAQSVKDKARAEDEARTSPINMAGIPDYAKSDPEIQSALRSQQQSNDYYKKGGGLDIQLQRDKINRQAHPFIQTLKDLWSLYS